MTHPDLLDETYERLHRTGPEFDGWLSNHGPMAADALARIGHCDLVETWLDGYLPRLPERPRERWPIEAAEWRAAIGDPQRLGDWTAYFEREVEVRSWTDLLATWWPRLLPGALGAATHVLIRTGHAVRALHEHDTAARRAELAHGLGYWAARWQPLPAHSPASGRADARTALAGISATGTTGGIRERLSDLAAGSAWAGEQAALAPVRDPAAVPAALDDLVDATVGKYAAWGRAEPVMLVHASTAPRAAALVIHALPTDYWVRTYQVAWAAAAAITAIYRPARTAHPRLAETRLSVDDLSGAIAEQGDPHGIKFAEVAFESHARANPLALTAVARAHEWLAA